MSEEEIIDILQNVICDDVIGTYCIEIQKQGIKCDKNCKDDDCYLFKAIQGIIDLYNKEKEKNKTLFEENAHWKASYFKLSRKIDTVSKDKIKEKIEQIESYAFSTEEERDCQSYAIDRLQELLEE